MGVPPGANRELYAAQHTEWLGHSMGNTSDITGITYTGHLHNTK